MKKTLSRLTAAVLCLCLALPFAASAAGLDSFTKKNTYKAGQFTDVSSSAWYAGDVRTCYELGLMNGRTASTFDPGGSITLAECIVIAARIHNIYRSGPGVFDQSGSPWYDIAVKYAISSKIIKDGDFSDYNAKATRAQMAYIFSSPLPESELTAINTVDKIPDVPAGASYEDAVYLLYRAGVLTGRGEEGSFDPTANITRSEVAAIVSRLIVPANRKAFTLSTEEPTDPDPVEPVDPVDPVDPADPDDGDDILPGQGFSYTDVQSFSEGYAVVRQAGGYTYVDTTGRQLSNTLYAQAYPFSEGKGVVLTARTEGGYNVGYLDRNGNYTNLAVRVGPSLSYTGTAGQYHDGMLFLQGAAPALVDDAGSLVSLNGLSPVGSSGDGLIPVNAALASQYPDLRYVDSKGNTILELTSFADLSGGAGSAVIEAGSFSGGMAPVRIGTFAGGKLVSSSWGAIDITGKLVVPAQLASFNFNGDSAFAGGIATGTLAGSSTPAIVTAGGSVIQLSDCSAVMAPSDDSSLVAAVKNGRYGYVNKNGREVISPQFDSAQPFSEGLAAVSQNGRYGFIAENGEWAFSAIYEDIRSFDGGFAWGKSGGLWYILEY